MNIITRWEQPRAVISLQDEVNRLFEDTFARDRQGQADLTTWA
jgi:hypothetical protein